MRPKKPHSERLNAWLGACHLDELDRDDHFLSNLDKHIKSKLPYDAIIEKHPDEFGENPLDNSMEENAKFISNRTILSGALQLDALLAVDPIDYLSLKDLHKSIYQAIRNGAGKERNNNLSKQTSQFATPGYIEDGMTSLINELKNDNYLADISREDLPLYCANHFNAFNMLHPFPFGNGVINRLLISNLLNQQELHLEWDKINRGQYTKACVIGFHGDLGALKDMFDSAISHW